MIEPARSSELTPAALADLGLESQPFTPVSRDHLFVDGGTRNLIDRLLHNLTYGDILLLLLGPPGSGKTALILALLDHLPGRLELFVARGQSGLSSERVVRDMLSTFQSNAPDDFAAAFGGLFDHLSASARKNIPAALVIDDADLIEPRQLEKLLELVDKLNQALETPLHLMLVGRPTLEPALSGISARVIREGRVFSTQVRPLSREQAADFIAHRLHAAGGKQQLPLSDAQWDSLYTASGGIPGQLQVMLAEHLNAQGAPKQAPRPQVKPRNLKIWPLATLGAALLALLLAWLMQDSTRSPPADRIELSIPDRGALRNPSSRPPVPAGAGESTSAEPELATEPANTADPAPAPVAQPGPEVTPPPAVSEQTARATDAEPEPVTPVPAASTAAAPDTGTPAPTTARSAPAEAPAAAPPASAVPTATATQQATGSARPQNATPAAAAVDANLLDAAWLRRQKPDAYTLQVLALAERETVEAFALANQFDRQTPAALFRTTHKGGDWFVLVTGVHADKNAARAALRRLPRSIRRNGPWMRSFASIQQALAADSR